MRIKSLVGLVASALIVPCAHAQTWTTFYDGSDTNGVPGTIELDDWDFIGPQGRQADNFEPYGGVFGNGTLASMGKAYCLANPADCGIGQIQHVITTGPDGLTPDAPADVFDDFLPDTGNFPQANVDSLTTFYLWGYTTQAGSTFNNMMIDLDGDYYIAQEDMVFEWYNSIDYVQAVPAGGTRAGSNPDGDYPNSLAFQPYAVSDAKGWCGSILASHPNAHEAMAGQVTFDIIMDVYQRAPDGSLVYFSSELTPDFEMRSFGDVTVNFTGASVQSMAARAVVNNTDPTVPNQSVGPDTPLGDLSWHNRVSFMGSNVLKSGSWCGIESAQWLSTPVADRGPGVKRYETVRSDLTTQAACETAGGVWDKNAFVGFAYILRADGARYIDYADPSYGPDPMTTDTDADTVLDFMDNCTMVSNGNQLDTDGDGFGNACDADFNDDGIVNSLDIGLLKSMYGATGNSEADLSGDGMVNIHDIVLFKQMFFQPPGPAGSL